MTWITPTPPTASTVITVAWAQSQIVDLFNHLRAMMGGSDPPAANRVVVSSSTSATAWAQVPTDAIANLAVTDAKIAANTISGDAKMIPSTITGNSGTSAIGAGVIHPNRIVPGSFDATQVGAAFQTDSIHVNRLTASLSAAEFARITGGGAVVVAGNIGTDAVTATQIQAGAVGNAELASSAVDNSKVSASAAITHDKLAATPSGYSAGSPFNIATSNTTAASTNVGIAGVYEIKVTFVVRMGSTSAANDANVAFTADLYKTSGIFGPQLRKYLPPAASAPGEGYDSQEYWMHFTIQQAMNASEPLALVVVKSGGTGNTRCEQAIISAVRIGP